jgi:hypothetical protein
METKYSSFIIVVFSLVSLMTDQVRFGLKNVGPTSPFVFVSLKQNQQISAMAGYRIPAAMHVNSVCHHVKLRNLFCS